MHYLENHRNCHTITCINLYGHQFQGIHPLKNVGIKTAALIQVCFIIPFSCTLKYGFFSLLQVKPQQSNGQF